MRLQNFWISVLNLLGLSGATPDPSKIYKELEQLDKQIERVRKYERDSE